MYRVEPHSNHMNKELSLNCLSYTQTRGSLSDMSQVEPYHGDMLLSNQGWAMMSHLL